MLEIFFEQPIKRDCKKSGRKSKFALIRPVVEARMPKLACG